MALSSAGGMREDCERPRLWVYLLATLIAPLILAIVWAQDYVNPNDLLRDPIAVAQGAAARGECCKAYFGAISQLGGLIWAGGGFVCLFAAAAIRPQAGPQKDRKYLASAGVLTGMLAFDDVFMGHEALYPKLLGIPELATVAIYAALVAIFLWKFRRPILRMAPELLVISLVAFALSVATDLIVSDQTSWRVLVEDGSKLVGISFWTTYFWWSALRTVKRSSEKHNPG